MEFGGVGGSFNSRIKMYNKVDKEIEKSVFPWFKKCQHQACICNFYSALWSIHSFMSSNYQLHSVFSTVFHLFWENTQNHWSNQMLLTAVVDTPMCKLLLSFAGQTKGCSKQLETPRQAKNNIYSFVLMWLPFSLELRAAVVSTSSAWKTEKSSVRLFLWFLKMSFWKIIPI